MQDTYEQALRVLGLEPGATEEAIKDAYRDLVKVWHPDRFGSDARLRAKAQDKLKAVNAAFEQLRGYRSGDFRGPRESAHPGGRGSAFTGAGAPESPVNRAKNGNTRNVLILSVAAVLAGFGAGLWHIRASLQFFQAQDGIRATVPARSAAVPVTRQPARREPEGPPSALPLTTGSLTVASRPLGARVSFGGYVVGETPITLTHVLPGEYEIEVALRKGYQPWLSSVVVTAGHEEKLLAVMTPTERGR